MEGDKPISYNSHSILAEHYYAFLCLLSKPHSVVTRSQTKAVGTKVQKVHGAYKVMDPKHKSDTRAERKGIPQPIKIILDWCPSPHQ